MFQIGFRLKDFQDLLLKEEKLCGKLVMKTIEQKIDMPSENDITAMEDRCNELEKIMVNRQSEMKNIQLDCIALCENLMLQFEEETFPKYFLQTTVDKMSLGEGNIQMVSFYQVTIEAKTLNVP